MLAVSVESRLHAAELFDDEARRAAADVPDTIAPELVVERHQGQLPGAERHAGHK
jgi:hypothetical protein